MFSENIASEQNYHMAQKQFSDDKCSAGKKLNFYNQISPASGESEFKDSQMISAFKSQNDSHIVN